MRFSYFRFTTRRLIALVAIVGTVMGSAILINRLMHLHAVYHDRAIEHDLAEKDARGVMSTIAEMESSYKVMAEVPDASPLDPEAAARWNELMKTDPEVEKVVASQRQQEKLVGDVLKTLEDFGDLVRSETDYQANLKRKYQAAAARPWLPVSPDGEDPAPDFSEMMLKVLEKIESKGAEMDHLPLPPRLEFAEPEPVGRK